MSMFLIVVVCLFRIWKLIRVNCLLKWYGIIGGVIFMV